ncbi:MAG TPA: helix-turn-helix transcriptional regulator, partial [Verrucomicrobiae bacterium]|nr:helix-turn-helix transcriptional regulator [Verrucomicrobiae bacterium]
NARRQSEGLSWNEVSKQMGVAASTIRRTERGGPMETDGVLAMVRWVEGVPEDFIQGTRAVPPKGLLYPGRFNCKALFEAIDEHRRARGMTWLELAQEIGNVSPPMLTRLSKGSRIEVNVMVALVSYLGRTVHSFTRRGALR